MQYCNKCEMNISIKSYSFLLGWVDKFLDYHRYREDILQTSQRRCADPRPLWLLPCTYSTWTLALQNCFWWHLITSIPYSQLFRLCQHLISNNFGRFSLKHRAPFITTFFSQIYACTFVLWANILFPIGLATLFSRTGHLSVTFTAATYPGEDLFLNKIYHVDLPRYSTIIPHNLTLL